MKRYLALVCSALLLAGGIALGVSVLGAPAAGAASGGYVATCGGGKVFLYSKERETLHRHNTIRKNHNLRPFCVHPDLQRVARAHSRDMIRRDYFSHGDVGGRLRNYGYNWSTYGENIAGGSGVKGEPAPIMNAWMDSAGHRKNILNGKFREIGVGAYTGTYKSYGDYTMYTADFGSR